MLFISMLAHSGSLLISMLSHSGSLLISMLSHSGSLPYYPFCRAVIEYPSVSTQAMGRAACLLLYRGSREQSPGQSTSVIPGVTVQSQAGAHSNRIPNTRGLGLNYLDKHRMNLSRSVGVWVGSVSESTGWNFCALVSLVRQLGPVLFHTPRAGFCESAAGPWVPTPTGPWGEESWVCFCFSDSGFRIGHPKHRTLPQPLDDLMELPAGPAPPGWASWVRLLPGTY